MVKTKENFQGFRIIKGNKNQFKVEKISDENKNKTKKNKIRISKPKTFNEGELLQFQNHKSKILNSNNQNEKRKNLLNKICEIKENINKNEYYSQKDFIKGEIKGKGRFGIVYSGLYSNSGEILAIKIYDNVSEDSKKKIFDNLKELYYLNHPNLIKAIPLVDTLQINKTEGKETFTIIYEISNGNSLKELIKKFGILQESIIQKYSKQILQGLQYLHSKNIIHKNLKCSNILVDSNGTIKISDSLIDSIILGNGKDLYEKLMDKKYDINNNDNSKNIDYTIPPFFIRNIRKNENYELNQSYDLWCLGCVLIECLSGNPPWSYFPFINQRDFIKFLNNTDLIPILPKKLSDQCKEFIHLLFDYKQTSEKDIYEKIFNLDFFKNSKNDNLSNNINEFNDKNSTKNSIILNQIINITTNINNNNQNINKNNSNNNKNLGQVLKNLKIVNVLNNNESPNFSITVSGISSNRNSFYNTLQSNKSSFLNGSCIVKRFGINNNVNNLNIHNNGKDFEIFEVSEANIEQSPITIKDPNVEVYNFENYNKVQENKNLQNYSILNNSQLKKDVEENEN